MRYVFLTTTPASSCPGTQGYWVVPMSLSAMCTSEWQTPQNFTSIVTSSSPPTFLSMLILWNLASLAVLASPNVVYMTAEMGAKKVGRLSTIVGVNAEYKCLLITILQPQQA